MSWVSPSTCRHAQAKGGSREAKQRWARERKVGQAAIKCVEQVGRVWEQGRHPCAPQTQATAGSGVPLGVCGVRNLDPTNPFAVPTLHLLLWTLRPLCSLLALAQRANEPHSPVVRGFSRQCARYPSGSGVSIVCFDIATVATVVSVGGGGGGAAVQPQHVCNGGRCAVDRALRRPDVPCFEVFASNCVGRCCRTTIPVLAADVIECPTRSGTRTLQRARQVSGVRGS